MCGITAARSPSKNAALVFARRLNRGEQDPDANTLDTLAVAQAASGRYQAAVQTALRAAQRAEIAGSERLASRIRSRAALYESGRPFRAASILAD